MEKPKMRTWRFQDMPQLSLTLKIQKEDSGYTNFNLAVNERSNDY